LRKIPRDVVRGPFLHSLVAEINMKQNHKVILRNFWICGLLYLLIYYNMRDGVARPKGEGFTNKLQNTLALWS